MTVEGWYDDPDDVAGLRYWDGEAWTEHRTPKAGAHEEAAAWPTAPAFWCRSCGVELSDTVADCPVCRWEARSPEPAPTCVGLLYGVRSKIGRTRLGLCVDEAGDQLTIHLDAKTVTELPRDEVQRRPEIPEELSTAGRLYRALALREEGSLKAKWDGETIKTLAWAHAHSSSSSMRRLADEAIDFEWDEIVDALPISPYERAWRRAHDAAQREELPSLYQNLRDLPDGGFHHRCGLLLPFVDRILAGDEDQNWFGLVDGWSPEIPGVSTLRVVLQQKGNQLGEIFAAADDLIPCLAESRRAPWMAAAASLESGVLTEPPFDEARAWTTYRSYQNPSLGSVPTLSDLTLALVDDLIDNGRLPEEPDLTGLPDNDRYYVLARTRPDLLDQSELAVVNHHDELARRCYSTRDTTGMSTLDPALPVGAHYTALEKFVAGDDEALTRVRADSRELLQLAADARAALTAGETDVLPDELAADPTLWVTLQDLAFAERIRATPEQRLQYPRFGEWLDLHQVISLIWDGRHREAEELARRLAETFTDEVLEDEALSLRAFALWQLGRPADALSCLEAALAGLYTEALLVNTSLVAADADPALATTYFTKLISEAPTVDLQIVAMHAAVQVWLGTLDLELPRETSDCLHSLLGTAELTEDVYLDFIKVAAAFDAERLARTPPPRPSSPPLAAMRDLYVGKANLSGGEASIVDYADKLIATGKTAKGLGWFDHELGEYISALTDSVMVDFGDAPLSAVAIDRFLAAGSDLLSRAQYFFLAPQAGTHQAAYFRRDDGCLNDAARARFFFVPWEEFRVERKDLPEGLVDLLVENFERCFVAYLFNQFLYSGNIRDRTSNDYNALVARLGWDRDNRHRIRRQMRQILEADQELIDDLVKIEERCRQFAFEDEKRREVIEKLRKDINSWQQEVIRLRSNL